MKVARVVWVPFLIVLTSCGVPRLRATSFPTPVARSSAAAKTPTANVEVPPEIDLIVASYHDRDGGALHLVDARSGVDLRGHGPIPLGRNYWHAVSPDGHTMAVVSFPDSSSPAAGKLILVDLTTWSVRDTAVAIDQWPTRLTFSPDGRRLAVASSFLDARRLLVLDVEGAKPLADIVPDVDPLAIAFTPDGRSLMVYGARYPGSPGLNPVVVAADLDAATLATAWEVEVTGVRDGEYAREGLSEQELHDTAVWWHAAVVPFPKAKRLYIVHADEDRLTTVDFARRSVETVDIRRPTSWLERLLAFGAVPAYAKELNGTTKVAAISVDGTRLYVLGWSTQSTKDASGNFTFDETHLGLQAIDVASGSSLATFATSARTISWSEDARRLVLGGWDKEGAPWSDLLSTEPLALLRHLRDLDLTTAVPVVQTSWLAASNPRSTSTTSISILHQGTWNVAYKWTLPGYAEVWAANLHAFP